MIQSIFIANLSEIAKPLADFMGKTDREHEIYEDHALCDRFLFSDIDNRLIITPFKLNALFVEDTFRLLKYRNTEIDYPDNLGDSICESILKDSRLIKKIIVLIKENPLLSLSSYAATYEFVMLVDWLRKKGLKFSTPELPDPSVRWTADFFDSKGGFRQAMSNLSIPAKLPLGFICQKKEEIIGCVEFFFKQNRGCVLKTNKGLAGAGLKIIQKKDFVKRNISEYINDLFKKENFWKSNLVVVEEFHDPDISVCGGSPSVEFSVTDNGVYFLYGCGMRITKEGVFKGVEVGKQAVPKKINDIIVRTGNIWGTFLQKMGYRGYFDIDFVLDKKGKLYPIESNLRRTGGTHVYELGRRLFGPQFQLNHYCGANNIIKAPYLKKMAYKKVRERLKSVLFPLNHKSEGIILTDITYLSHGNIGYVAVGDTKQRVEQIEQQFNSLI